MEVSTDNRTRMNVSVDAKGLVTMDITCEYTTPEQSADALERAIDLYREVCAKKNLTLLTPQA